ncbi:Hypothetical protein MELLADRAFT_58366 [Melampsora larici-populina 98AG31]|uniref:Uncharacterized protein n=1 Tax=Melampsora larici-populina (strain 98AG31 / pathotype 3-4-7) TaxID=747676 RepID=F4R387_MELLP|nr:Hypothetical protein MELLADRAFT_58366 [Melampsora larici-populina 98AG31]EGG13212.1 Hypothetical protein MELLADRAFT_58366 [Melampsora larici-populina 98AG31]
MSFHFIRSSYRSSIFQLAKNSSTPSKHLTKPYQRTFHTQIKPRNQLPKWIGLSTIILSIGLISYTVFPTSIHEGGFPKEIKKNLRFALLAEKNGELIQSKKFFKYAYELGRLEGIELMKLSGIGIRWGSMLESFDEIQEAKEVYLLVFKDLEDRISNENGNGIEGYLKMRMVSVAQKLAQISNDKKLIEKYLTWSVEELLKLSLPGIGSNRSRENEKIVLGEIELPEWVKGIELGSCLESLGDFYAQNGEPEYSLTLYLQALSILLPPKPRKKEPTVLERCHASILMNNISQLHLQRKPKMISQSKEWLKKALELIPIDDDDDEVNLNQEERFECLKNRMVIEENLGSLEEMMGDLVKAKERFLVGKELAKELKVGSWIDRTDENLKRIELKQIGQKDIKT